MNPYALLPFAALLVNGFIWVYVYAQKRRDRVNTAYLLFAAQVAAWLAVELFTWLDLPEPWLTTLVRIEPVVWLPVGLLFLRFTQAALGRSHDRTTPWLLILLLGAIGVSLFTPLVVTGVEHHHWGTDEVAGPLFVPFVVVLFTFPFAYSMWLLQRGLRQSQHDQERRCLALILRGGVLTILLGTSTDLLPIAFGFDKPLDLAAVGSTLLTLHIYAAVVRYNFLAVTVETVAAELFGHASEGVLALDPHGIITLANPAAHRLLGRSDRPLIGDRLPPAIAAAEGEGDELELAPGEAEPRVIAVSFSPIVRDQLDLGRLCVLRDVSERRRSEQALRQSEERFRIFSEITTEGVILHNHGVVLAANSVAAAMLGRELDEVLGSHTLSHVAAEDHAGIMQHVVSGERARYEVTVLRRDGSRFPAEVRSQPLGSKDSTVRAMTVRDLTETRQLEGQLRQMQKMEAIGTLAGGIAHDFNNLLTGILGYASLLKGTATPGELAHRAADVIERAATRGADLTNQLLSFARRGKLRESPVDLHEVIRQVIAILSRTIDPRITLDARLEARPSVVLGDAGQLDQVLLNLGVNARDAVGEAGEIVFATTVVELDDDFRRRHSGLRPGHHLKVSVADSGGGIPERIRDRIFEPFFTTKQSSGGTGMGLAMVFGAVESHGGTIEVESEEQRGTTFHLYLPLAATAATTEPAEEPQPESGRGSILIVDDEALVRDTAADMLSRLGYDTVQASDGRAAVDYYRCHRQAVDLVLLDLMMPTMDGQECFHQLRALDRNVKVVMSTGYAVDAAVQQALDGGVRALVHKPYRLAQLADAVRLALASEPSAEKLGTAGRRRP